MEDKRLTIKRLRQLVEMMKVKISELENEITEETTKPGTKAKQLTKKR